MKNTEFAYGCAVYTGSDTKMSQNSKMKSNKFSSIEVSMNKYLLLFLFILLFLIVLSTILSYTIGIDRPNLDDSEVPWYLNTESLDLNAKTIFQGEYS